MGTSRIDIKMPPQRPRTIPCSSRARLFVNNQALDAHFNDVHRARPTPRVVPKDRGNLAPAKSHPPSQKNPKPLQGIYLASESDRTGLTNNCDNADRLVCISHRTRSLSCHFQQNSGYGQGQCISLTLTKYIWIIVCPISRLYRPPSNKNLVGTTIQKCNQAMGEFDTICPRVWKYNRHILSSQKNKHNTKFKQKTSFTAKAKKE